MHWFFDPSFSQASNAIAKSELDHFKSLRIRVGERVAVTNGTGDVFICDTVDPKSGELNVLEENSQPAPKPRIHLVQALAKGDRDEMALQACVELGVISITPWQAELSIVDWTGKESKGQTRWQEIAISAMKQSQRAHLPGVNKVQRTSELMPRGVGVVLDPRSEGSLLSLPSSEEITLVVGPEGGITEKELEQLKAAGFIPMRLGSAIMRTSTAGPAAVAAILTKLQTW
jgi:16S rRNA (uracil1498-N3)-methyltransferase